MTQMPFSQACENNKEPILEVLGRLFCDCSEVLEVASGTGQHAVWLSQHLPHLRWQPTELAANLEVLRPRCEQYSGSNLLPLQALDVSARPWPVAELPDAVFTANSLHIMPWQSVCALFAELAARARSGTLLTVYGPFNYNGRYTSESNASFDQWLAQRNPESAIRDFEEVDALAREAGFELIEDNAMPANNRLLAWRSQ